MNRRVAKAAGVAGAVTFMLALAGPASGLVSRDVIRAQAESTYAGGNGNGGAFIQPAGFVAELENDDPDAKHNVVSVDDGPDGGPLFASPLVDPDENAEVEGTQYLEAGSYRFICTIHSGMEGNLQVESTGAKPRPDVSVAVASKKLKNLKKGKLEVSRRGGDGQRRRLRFGLRRRQAGGLRRRHRSRSGRAADHRAEARQAGQEGRQEGAEEEAQGRRLGQLHGPVRRSGLGQEEAQVAAVRSCRSSASA